jgi:uncharacterized protein (TIGR00251 family)
MNSSDLKIRETGLGLEIQLHVLPRAKRSELSGLHNGALKLKITAPPVDDAANRAIVEFFSRLLGISKSGIQIVSGLKSREKTLQVQGITRASFLKMI